MSYDIHGFPLKSGYCEVHPHVHQEYPCSLCYAEIEKHHRMKQEELRVSKAIQEERDASIGVIEQIGQEIYQSMKGFRVKNTHAKKCAINAVNLVLKSTDSSAKKMYYGKILAYIENLKV